MSKLEAIIANPNRMSKVRGVRGRGDIGNNHITCADGFKLSVVTGENCYCTPQGPVGPYTHVEVGYPSEPPEPVQIWKEFAEDTEALTSTVYHDVPVRLVRDLIALHGGESP